MNFVQEQLKIIKDYEININKYHNLKKDNFDTIKDLMTIKNKSRPIGRDLFLSG